MANVESNGHVTDDVTWPWKVMVMTPICFVPSISKMAGWRYRWVTMEHAPIGNGVWRVEWSRDTWRHVTLKDQSRDPQYIWCALSRKLLKIDIWFQKNHEQEIVYGKSNGQVLDDVACASLLIRNWLTLHF